MRATILRLSALIVVAIALVFAGALLPRYLGYLESQTAFRACLNVAEFMFHADARNDRNAARHETFLLTCMATRVAGAEVKLQ